MRHNPACYRLSKNDEYRNRVLLNTVGCFFNPLISKIIIGNKKFYANGIIFAKLFRIVFKNDVKKSCDKNQKLNINKKKESE